MRSMSFMIFLLLTAVLFAQHSPHGGNFKIECTECHTADSWKVIPSTMAFKHASTGFKLEGQHNKIQCRSCHGNLQFDQAKPNCNSCHTDIHKASVGPDCQRCHTPQSWIVKNMNTLHQATRFPLPGVHKNADCIRCHEASQSMDFSVKGIACYDCHAVQFHTAQNPNHAAANFSRECTQCHSVLSSTWRKTAFSHNFFPLTGVHAIENCYACHNKNTYTGLSQDCYSCHRTDFEKAANPNHLAGNFSTNCLNCHNRGGWKPASFNHSNTRFALTGIHTTTPCQACHTTGYTATPMDCNTCHNTKYQQTTNPNHTAVGFPVTCETCHNPKGWTPASFEHDGPYFPIYSGSHLAKWNNCADCHVTPSNYKLYSCTNCHDHNRTVTDQQHVGVSGYAYSSSACLACHPRGSNQGAFNHQTSRFPLTGAHTTKSCDQCHTNGYTSAPPIDCAGCHAANAQIVVSPDHKLNGFSQLCATCHTTTAWKPSTFDHSVKFQLTGSHVATACNKCHVTAYTGTSKSCEVCHQANLATTTNPDHRTGNFPQVCTNCHNTSAWKPSTFSHSTTQFQLTGAHVSAQCNKCHTTQYSGTTKECKVCHQANLAVTSNPDHRTANFPQQCADCHNTTAWKPSTFNHSNTPFALTGKHTSLLCSKCHTTSYPNTPTDCYGCHQAAYQNSTNPNHISAGLPTTCATCHTTDKWTGAVFNHDGQYFPIYSGKHLNTWTTCATCHTSPSNYKIHSCVGCHEHNQSDMDQEHRNVNGYLYESNACLACHPRGTKQGSFNHQSSNFPLTGTHTTSQCTQCHANGYLTPPPTQCVSCHQTEMQRSTNPKHSMGNFPQTCTDCHNTTTWKPSTFSHNNTQFQLAGKHVTTLCNDCHTAQYSGTSKECKICHDADRSRAADPNHLASFFPQDACSKCHSTDVWKPASFSHTTTQFQLTGAHVSTSCNKCHTTAYTGLPKLCVNCHQGNLTATTNPNHRVGNFPTECTNCHTTQAWKPSSFNHSVTQFQLTGAHVSQTCDKCHSQQWSGTPKTCYPCHQTQYQTGTNPNHAQANFAQTCQDCHTTSVWKPANWNHTTTGFSLTGKHITTACNQCHATAYANTPSACDGCHHSDFTSATNPNHVSNQFPVTCQTCHTTTAWSPANYNHDAQYFKIYSGHHKGRWTSCTQCHSNSSNYQVFTCMSGNCHSASSMNNEHRSVSGYQYVASECYRCHRTAEPSRPAINHNKTQFPLVGAHASLDCSRCHKTKADLTVDCYSCHRTAYETTTLPPHARYNFVQACNTCHTQNSWKPASFGHNHFPLSVQHRVLACTECHSEPNYRMQCLSCHQTDFEKGHRAVGNTACWKCHSTTGFTHNPKLDIRKTD